MKKLALLSLLLVTACATVPAGLDANGDAIPLATYAVADNMLQGEVTQAHQAQWDRFNQLIPAQYHPEIVQYQPIDAEATDGIDGAVAPVGDGREQWLFQIDTSGTVEQHELDRTMVHEYAHLMTLRLAQIPAGGSEESCATFYVDEGCPVPTSYLAMFGQQFWPEGEVYDDGMEDRYAAATDAYVTEYAATSAIEDVAEAFAEYVVHPERWEGDSVADAKVQFFGQFPELVRLRSVIRSNL